jgi:hypothetical protein
MKASAIWIGILTVLMLGIVAGCGSLFPGMPGPSASEAPTADLHVVNTKADTISIEVNGIAIGAVRAGDVVTIPQSRLPAAPWRVEARGPGGQLVITLNASAEDLLDAANGTRSIAGTDDDGCGIVRLRVGGLFNETEPPAGIASCGP